MTGSTISGSIGHGIALGSGGYDSPLTITSTGTVEGAPSTPGLVGNVPGGYILNEGTIFSSRYEGRPGIYMPGAVIYAGTTLANGGYIIGGTTQPGVSASGYVHNLKSGTIAGNYGNAIFSAAGAGIDLFGSGTVRNDGVISGGQAGSVREEAGVGIGGSGTVINYGTVEGGYLSDFIQGLTTGVGIALSGKVINDGVIEAGQTSEGSSEFSGNGVVLYHDSALTNTGTIMAATGLGGGIGVLDRYGAAIVNAGSIIGGAGIATTGGAGVDLAQGGTLIDSGMIAGGASYGGGVADAVMAGAGATRIVIDPGALFKGAVVADASFQNSLEFGAGAGSLDMGGSFSGFETIDFDAGAQWDVAGSTAELASGETITGFTLGDTLVVEGFTASSDSYVSGAGLVLSDGAATETVDITGGFTTGSFDVTGTALGTQIVICYLRGTRILTPAGEVPIEDLDIGDAVITRFGGYQKIKWIGRQSFGAAFVKQNRDRIPVRICACALAPGVPKRDLFVSPGHSMLLGKTLVLARHLVNGVTITQDFVPDEIHYFLPEFETHDCVCAEGAWSESFADGPGLRGRFHNVTEFFELHPGYVTPERLSLCAKRPEAGPALAAVLGPVVARAAALVQAGPLQGCIDEIGDAVSGWAQDIRHPELPVLLEVFSGARVFGTVLACGYRADLEAAGLGTGRCHFAFTMPHGISRTARRRVGVRRALDGAALAMPWRRQA